MLLYANHYYNFGFNVTHVARDINSQSIIKSASHEIDSYLNKRQSIKQLHSLNWKNSTGVGVVLGYQKLRALDIDGCTDINFIKLILSYLELPLNYEWVVKSGSGNGFHIIFFADDHRFVTETGKVRAFLPNKLFNFFFKHIELRWYAHLVLPPSLHSSGGTYKFTNNSFPYFPPRFVTLYSLEKIIALTCLKIGSPLYQLVDHSLGYLSYEPIEVNEYFSKSYDGFNALAIELEEPDNSDDDYLLFVDIETTGLPKNYNASITDVSNWPRIVQLSYLLYCINGDRVKDANYIIKPENFVIPVEATEIHGITNEMASKGESNIKALLEFQFMVSKANVIIAHNIDFDVNTLACEFYRLFKHNPLANKKTFCMMKDPSIVQFCKIPVDYNQKKYKWPSLTELHKILFNEDFSDKHNSFADVKATAKCFWELIDLNEIQMISNSNTLTIKSPLAHKMDEEQELYNAKIEAEYDYWKDFDEDDFENF